MSKTLKSKIADDREYDSDYKILNFKDFVRFVEENELDVFRLTYGDMKEPMPKSSFYKFLGKYKDEMETFIVRTM